MRGEGGGVGVWGCVGEVFGGRGGGGWRGQLRAVLRSTVTAAFR